MLARVCAAEGTAAADATRGTGDASGAVGTATLGRRGEDRQGDHEGNAEEVAHTQAGSAGLGNSGRQAEV